MSIKIEYLHVFAPKIQNYELCLLLGAKYLTVCEHRCFAFVLLCRSFLSSPDFDIKNLKLFVLKRTV